jgi:hypothetical protein
VGVPHAVLATLMAAGAAALLFVSIGGNDSGDRPAAPVSRPSAGETPAIAIRRVDAGEGFTVAGAAFRVVASPGAGWARTAVASAPGTDRRWIVAAVEVRNLDRRGFDPGLLSYLLRGRGGMLYAPERAGVVGPNSLGTATGLRAGEVAEERLLFRVPASLRRPVLAIQPSAERALEVRVPLAQ